MKVRLMLIAGACMVAAGCASPEATRQRAGGPGGDVGNRTANVRMHGGSYEYYKTPERIPVKHPSLDNAQQAKKVD